MPRITCNKKETGQKAVTCCLQRTPAMIHTKASPQVTTSAIRTQHAAQDCNARILLQSTTRDATCPSKSMMQVAGCRLHGDDNKQRLTLAFHMVMVAVSPGGTRMMGVPFTILLRCCGAAACWSDLQAAQQTYTPPHCHAMQKAHGRSG